MQWAGWDLHIFRRTLEQAIDGLGGSVSFVNKVREHGGGFSSRDLLWEEHVKHAYLLLQSRWGKGVQLVRLSTNST